MRTLFLTAIITAFAVAFTANSASAAKGEKKSANGEHVIEGTVVSVQAANNGQASFVVHVHHKKKAAAAGQGQAGNAAAQAGQAAKGVAQAGQAGAGKGKGKGHTITVNQNTRFEGGGGKGQQQASFSSLKAGEHVTVHLQNKTAEKVVIHNKGKGQKKKA